MSTAPWAPMGAAGVVEGWRSNFDSLDDHLTTLAA